MSCEEGGTIYYTILGEDPLASGVRYEEPIYLEEGVWRLRAVTEKNGVYSQELVQSYTVSKPVPDMPKASLQSGTYDSVRTVSLRAGSDTVIYYTIDGTQPTTESKQYNPDEPIQLRIGKTVIRAIAVNIEGKKSNELNIEYECGGRTAYSMNAKDTVGDLALFETTQSEFVALYGQPQSEQSDGRDALGTYTKLTYAFGYATFLDRGTGGEPSWRSFPRARRTWPARAPRRWACAPKRCSPRSATSAARRTSTATACCIPFAPWIPMPSAC